MGGVECGGAQRCGAIQRGPDRADVRVLLRGDTRAVRSETEAGEMPHVPVDEDALHLIDLALNEDRGTGDVPTTGPPPARAGGGARIVAKAPGIIAGLGGARAVFGRTDPRVEGEAVVRDRA